MTTLGQKKSISTKEDFIKSIDAMFLKLELAYHYQFYKVFGTDEKLKEGKKLWAITLKNESPETILAAVEKVVASQSYLPTLTDLIKACKEINKMDGFPTAEEAYRSKKSFQPRAEFNWSHPIIYFTGKKIGWNNLIEKDTKENFNLFKKIFNNLKMKLLMEKFEIKDNTDLETRKPLNKDLFEKLKKNIKFKTSNFYFSSLILII